MMFKKTAAAAAVGALVSSVAAQRPTNTSICDYYTTALLKNNTAANQYTLLTLLVNTVVIGNYTQPNMNAVPGILANGTVNGTAVSLIGYFDGALASTNTGGSSGQSVNFLDGGGAAPLMKNMPANDTTSNQYMLLTHLYQFFGALLGCSGLGSEGFPAYAGSPSMYEVHKFMVLDIYQENYFITQVALAAQSFGVAAADITAAGAALTTLFNYRCAPATTVIPSAGPQFQAICTDNATCPLSANASCSSQPSFAAPGMANSSNMASGSGGSSNSSTGSGSSSGSGSTGSGSTGSTGGTSTGGSGAAQLVVSFGGLVGAAALLVLA